MMISLMGLLPLAAAALFVVVCVLVVLRAVVAPAESRKGAHCGGCGYELAQISDERCPECGARLLRVGITTPAAVLRHRSSGLLAGLAWTALVGLLCGMSFGVVTLFSSPFGGMTTGIANQRITSTNTFTPPTQWSNDTNRFERENDYSVTLNSDITTDETGMAASGSITLTVARPDGQKAEAVIDAISLTYSVDGSEQPEPFDADAAAALIERIGFDPESETVQQEASQVSMLVQAAKSDPLNYETALYNANLGAGMLQSAGGSVSSFSPAGLPSGAVTAAGFLGFWGLTWLAGLFLINWRRRRLFSEATTAAA